MGNINSKDTPTTNLLSTLFERNILTCNHSPRIELQAPKHTSCDACCRYQVCAEHDCASAEMADFKKSLSWIVRCTDNQDVGVQSSKMIKDDSEILQNALDVIQGLTPTNATCDGQARSPSSSMSGRGSEYYRLLAKLKVKIDDALQLSTESELSVRSKSLPEIRKQFGKSLCTGTRKISLPQSTLEHFQSQNSGEMELVAWDSTILPLSCLQQETVCAPSASINNDSASSGEKTFGKITVDESSMDDHFEITDINDNDSVASQEESVKTFSELELHMQQDEEEEILRDAEVHHHGESARFSNVRLFSDSCHQIPTCTVVITGPEEGDDSAQTEELETYWRPGTHGKSLSDILEEDEDRRSLCSNTFNVTPPEAVNGDMSAPLSTGLEHEKSFHENADSSHESGESLIVDSDAPGPDYLDTTDPSLTSKNDSNHEHTINGSNPEQSLKEASGHHAMNSSTPDQSQNELNCSRYNFSAEDQSPSTNLETLGSTGKPSGEADATYNVVACDSLVSVFSNIRGDDESLEQGDQTRCSEKNDSNQSAESDASKCLEIRNDMLPTSVASSPNLSQDRRTPKRALSYVPDRPEAVSLAKRPRPSPASSRSSDLYERLWESDEYYNGAITLGGQISEGAQKTSLISANQSHSSGASKIIYAMTSSSSSSESDDDDEPLLIDRIYQPNSRTDCQHNLLETQKDQQQFDCNSPQQLTSLLPRDLNQEQLSNTDEHCVFVDTIPFENPPVYRSSSFSSKSYFNRNDNSCVPGDQPCSDVDGAKRFQPSSSSRDISVDTGYSSYLSRATSSSLVPTHHFRSTFCHDSSILREGSLTSIIDLNQSTATIDMIDLDESTNVNLSEAEVGIIKNTGDFSTDDALGLNEIVNDCKNYFNQALESPGSENSDIVHFSQATSGTSNSTDINIESNSESSESTSDDENVEHNVYVPKNSIAGENNLSSAENERSSSVEMSTESGSDDSAKKRRKDKKVDFDVRLPKFPSEQLGVNFPVSLMHRQLKNNESTGKYRIQKTSCVFMSSALSYVTREVLDLSALSAQDSQPGTSHPVIHPRNIMLALRGDSELNELTKNVIIPGSGTQSTY